MKTDATLEEFKPCFYSIQDYYYSNYKIVIDKVCSDPTRLMFISSDENIFYNPFSLVYSNKLYPASKQNPIPAHFNYTNNNSLTDILISKIKESKIDITSSYQDWLKIAFALVSEFGLNGLNYFHQLSQFHPNYTPEETTKVYNTCYRSGSRQISIKSLYKICSWFGITYKS
jgi:hypothetical protein